MTANTACMCSMSSPSYLHGLGDIMREVHLDAGIAGISAISTLSKRHLGFLLLTSVLYGDVGSRAESDQYSSAAKCWCAH